MQAYSKIFARVYNMRWGDFAKTIGPLILDFYKSTPIQQTNKFVLGLCCGTGQLAVQFLVQGYRVFGIDLSEHMLRYARENAGQFLESGQAKFLLGDASSFELEERFGLVVSTFDALNHLPDETALQQCFQCVFDVLEEGGYFIFDLNTRLGLMRWNNISVDDNDKEITVITRGVYDGEGSRAWTRISGFIRVQDDLYERFEEAVFNTVFELASVRQALLDGGWREVYFARVQELETPILEPEEGRVFIVAQK